MTETKSPEKTISTSATLASQRIADIEAAIARIEQAAARSARELAEQKAFRLKFDDEAIKLQEDRHREVSRRFQCLIERVTICTEIRSYVGRHEDIPHEDRIDLLNAAIWVLDQPDSYIASASNRSTAEWARMAVRDFREQRRIWEEQAPDMDFVGRIYVKSETQ